MLESIANIHSALKAQKLNEHNSAIISAKQQAHHSLGNLIKLCDDALISDNEENFIALNKETVKEIIENLDNAVTVSLKVQFKVQSSTEFLFCFRIWLVWPTRKLTAQQTQRNIWKTKMSSDRRFQIFRSRIERKQSLKTRC